MKDSTRQFKTSVKTSLTGGLCQKKNGESGMGDTVEELNHLVKVCEKIHTYFTPTPGPPCPIYIYIHIILIYTYILMYVCMYV